MSHVIEDEKVVWSGISLELGQRFVYFCEGIDGGQGSDSKTIPLLEKNPKVFNIGNRSGSEGHENNVNAAI